jgi:uncharacterized protein
MKLRRSRDASSPSPGPQHLVLYFASDIHGSTLCWKKFLAAPRFYGAHVIIIGGDVTGKFLVPIVRQSSGIWKARYHGSDRVLTSKEEVEELKVMAENSGAYPVELNEEDFRALQAEPQGPDDLFFEEAKKRLERWVELADDRLARENVKCFVSGGNDDPFEIDKILERSEAICVPDRQVVAIDDDIEMLSLGYANQTPWNCPRDVSEEELGRKIEGLASELRNVDHSVFNIHVPPHDTGLDWAPELDPTMKPVRSASGELNFIPVGSTAVRAAIEHWQPLLALHGHIHESQGIKQLGRTVVANPGSEYQEGLLNGILVKIDKRSWKVSAQLVAG